VEFAVRAPADLPNRGNVSSVPLRVHATEDGRVAGTVRFRRYHLGRNNAVHGGMIGLMFDSLLGYTTAVLTQSAYQRTAHLGIDYRKIVPINKELQVEAHIDASKTARSSSTAASWTTARCSPRAMRCSSG
jgi:acyl-coenzyme A thioesterase PaaI-like protein